MDKKLIFRISSIVLLVIFLLGIFTASKNIINKPNKETDTANTIAINDTNYKESDEDLTTVDYKEFYDLLSPHGQWIQVPENEIGIKSKQDNNDAGAKKSPLSGLIGVKDAKADEFNLGMVFVWKPSPDAGVIMTAGSSPVYVPYSNGQWVYTDRGWYFKAPTPWEETIHHYGRWIYSPAEGWLWVPGRVWAPAWVDWRENDEYVSWAPLPPSVYIDNDQIYEPMINYDDYIIVERRHFIDPRVYKYDVCNFYTGSGISASIFAGTAGIIVSNNILINRGPDVHYIEKSCGRSINMVNIHYIRNINEIKYADRNYYVYTPQFRRFEKNKGDIAKFEPKSFKKYDDIKNLKLSGLQPGGNNDPRTLKNSSGERKNIFMDFGKSYKNQNNQIRNDNTMKSLREGDNNRMKMPQQEISKSDRSLKSENKSNTRIQNKYKSDKENKTRSYKNLVKKQAGNPYDNTGSYKNQQRQRMKAPDEKPKNTINQDRQQIKRSNGNIRSNKNSDFESRNLGNDKSRVNNNPGGKEQMKNRNSDKRKK